MRTDRTYLSHIREAVKSIEEYLEGVTYDEFVSNGMLLSFPLRGLVLKVRYTSWNLKDMSVSRIRLDRG